jgi:Xaa-Pro aminopeptidase
MPLSPPSVLDPVSTDNLQLVDLDRLHEVERRHALLAEYLSLRNLDALLLQRPENFAWLSCGGDCTRNLSGSPAAALFVTADARLALCQSPDSGQLFDRELNGLGFQLKERPWTEPLPVLMNDLCRGRQIASDHDLEGTIHEDLSDFRCALSDKDHEHLRALGRELTHCLEAAARHCERGDSESELAGHLCHRMMRREISPVSIQVMADGQGRRYRHWAYGPDHIERFAVLTAIGRRNGLHVGVSRTICFGSPPQQLVDAHSHCCLLQSTGMYFSQRGWAFSETWSRVARIYEKFGAAEEWRAAEQANVIGYDACEAAITPHSSKQFLTGSAVFWHPSVRNACVGDTVLLREQGLEVLTGGENWPMLPVTVKGESFPQPAILYRESAPSSWNGDE